MIDSKSSNAKSDVQIFKYADAKRFLGGVLTIWLFILALFVMVLHQDGSYRPYAFFVPILLFIGWAISMSLADRADVEVTSRSISRRFSGWLMQKIEWQSVRVIKVFESYDQRQHKVCLVVHICPQQAKTSAWLLNRKKMVLSDLPMSRGRFSELISLINACVAKYEISIESTVDGTTSHPDSLVFVPKKPDHDPIDWYNR